LKESPNSNLRKRAERQGRKQTKGSVGGAEREELPNGA
jgi:hypothetical protein